MEKHLQEIEDELTKAKTAAQQIAEEHPEGKKQVEMFISNLSRIHSHFIEQLTGAELQPWWHDIINGITVATGYASLMIDRKPEHAAVLERFIEDISQARANLVSAIYPSAQESRPDASSEINGE